MYVMATVKIHKRNSTDIKSTTKELMKLWNMVSVAKQEHLLII